MITFSNVRVDDTASFTASERDACALLEALAVAARERARDRWQLELVAWLVDRRGAIATAARAGVDIGEIAWTPEHFEDQQRFVVAAADLALDLALLDGPVADALARLRDLAAAHRRELVSVGRRWQWVGDRPSVGPRPATVPGTLAAKSRVL